MATFFAKITGSHLITKFAATTHACCSRAKLPQHQFTVARALATINPIKPFNSSRRTIDKRHPNDPVDNGAWSVVAYNLSEELRIENAYKLQEKSDEYQIIKLPTDIQDVAVMLSAKQSGDIHSRQNHDPDMTKRHGLLKDIFLFREGSIVFWGVPYDQQKRLLYGLASLKINPNEPELIEREHMNYTLNDSSDKSRLIRDTIQLSTNQDLSLMQLDQFAYSHAIALSVKLGVLEMTLEEYIESVAWISENMKSGIDIRLSKDQVFKKTGEVLCLKHSINLSSDLLDLPDVYWDRRDQEDMFLSLSGYLNIRKRTNVMNEKLNNCCELMNLLASHMNDRHHIRLEWMIIVLITVEVLFEVARFF